MEEKIGHTFTNAAILQRALTHRSYCNENNDADGHSERLEFLGDSVLQLVVVEYMYTHFPDRTEGTLSRYTSAIVREETLVRAANNLKIEQWIRRGHGCAVTPSLLGDAIEAVIGALYLDAGLKEAGKFIKTHILVFLDEIIEKKLYIDSKTIISEKAQSMGIGLPVYETVEEEAEGRPEKHVFTSTIFLGEKKRCQGSGVTKKEAEQMAAARLLHELESE